ncbi:MAG: tetratricopeptide repeat protein [Saprospiraceae bacterium]
MNSIKVYLIVLLCLAYIISSAQSAKEKQVDELLLIADSLLDKHKYLQARTIASQTLALAKSSPPFHQGIADAYMRIGFSYKGAGEYEPALDNYENALRIRVQTLNDPIGVARTYSSMSSVLLEIGEVDQALNYAQKAENIYISQDSYESDSLRARLYNNMANIYEDYENSDSLNKAVEINKKGLALSVIAKDTTTIMQGEYGLAKRLLELEQFDEAKVHLQKALNLNLKTNRPDSIFLGHIYEALGVMEMRKTSSNLDTMIFYLKQAEAITLKFPEAKGRLVNIYFNLAEAFENKDDLDNAEKSYKQAFESYQDANTEPDLYELLESRISGIGLDKQRRKVEKWLNLSLWSLVVALSIATFFIFFSYKKEKANSTANKLLYDASEKAKDLENRLFIIRHDIIKNHMQIISRLITESRNSDFNNVLSQIEHVVNRLRVSLDYAKPLKETLKGLAKMVHKEAEIVSGIAVIDATVYEDLTDLSVSPEMTKELMLFVVEVFTNIRNYAFNESHSQKIAIIKVEYHFENGLTIVIEDKGRGFDFENTPKSGLNSIQTKAKNLNWKLYIHSEIGKGTTVKIQIPEQYDSQ